MIDTSRAEPLRARRLLARYGDALLSDLLDHKEADLRGKGDTPRDDDLAKLDATAEGRGRAAASSRTGSATSR